MIDQMTPKERMEAFAKGEDMDHLPLVPDMGVTMAGYIGATTTEYYSDSETIKDTEVALFKRFEHDSVSVSTTLRGMAEAMGSVMAYSEDSLSLLKDPVIKSEDDLDKLDVIDPWKDGQLHVLLEALEKIRDEIGDVASIGASMTAPFSVAASVLGTERLLKWIRKHPEALHKVMENITMNNREYIKALKSIGFSTGFCCPVSSNDLISPKQFREFSLSYLKKNVEDVIELTGSNPGLHICGNSRMIWEDLRGIGIGNFSIDNCESLIEAKEVLGDEMVISGNVPPVDVVHLGTKEEIEESVRQCIEDGKDSPKGYVMTTGCQIPKDTPIENIDYFMAAGRKYGKL